MSIGASGRIVVEVDPDVKRQLYSALARNGLTLKEWFLRNVEAYLENDGQISLPLAFGTEAKSTDRVTKSSDSFSPTQKQKG